MMSKQFLNAGKRLAGILCLVAIVLVGASTGTAGAIEFKAKGVWQIAFEHSNVTPRGVKGADSFGALQRFRTTLEFIASENLSGAVQFEIGNNNWGEASEGGALGADGQVVEIRYAYLDWIVPQTEIKVRMGLQLIKLPGVLSRWGFGAVFGHDMAGITVSSPVYRSSDLNVDASFFWARPYNDNSTNTFTDSTNTKHLDNLDVFALSVPFTWERVKLNPWVMYAMIGKYSLSGLATVNEPAIVVPRGGLMPVMGGGYTSFQKDHLRNLDRAWGDGIWAGLCGEIFLTDSLKLGFEGAYGSVNMGEVQHYTGFGDANGRTFEARRAGWYVGARLDWMQDWGTPGILAWYGPGDDGNPYNGSERLPSFNTPWGVTALGFGGGDFDAATWKVLGHNPSGMAAVVAQIDNISFIEDLTHVIRFGYYWGTNSKYMPKKANMTWPSRADGPAGYLTTTDTAYEINLVNRYKIYENLNVSLEAAYVHLNLDKDTWGDSNDGNYKVDNYRVSCCFTYTF